MYFPKQTKKWLWEPEYRILPEGVEIWFKTASPTWAQQLKPFRAHANH